MDGSVRTINSSKQLAVKVEYRMNENEFEDIPEMYRQMIIRVSTPRHVCKVILINRNNAVPSIYCIIKFNCHLT